MGINPSGLPDIDPGQPIRDAAYDMCVAAGAISTLTTDIQADWSPLGLHYHAPEQHKVLTAMNKPVTLAGQGLDDVRDAANALTTYANTCDALITKRNTLRDDIVAFNTRPEKHGFKAWVKDHTGIQDWEDHGEEGDLFDRVLALKSDLDRAQADCATALNAIWGGDPVELNGETWNGDKSTFGFTKDAYAQAAMSGTLPDGTKSPWGIPGSWTSKNVIVQTGMAFESVKVDGGQVIGFVGDLTTLRGGGRAKAAWSGLGQLAGDGIATSPAFLVPTLIGVGPFKGVRDRQLERGKALIGAGRWSNTPGYTTGSTITTVLSLGSVGVVKTGAKSAAGAAARGIPTAATTVKDLAAAQKALATGKRVITYQIPEGTFRKPIEWAKAHVPQNQWAMATADGPPPHDHPGSHHHENPGTMHNDARHGGSPDAESRARPDESPAPRNANSATSFDHDRALKSGTELDPKDKRGEFELAGNALAKHAGRGTNQGQWPIPSGRQNPAAWNSLGRETLKKILTDPRATTTRGRGRVNGRWQETIDVRLPDGGIGARFSVDGKFSGFLD